ncbi:glycosyltransferase [Methylobacterium sp. Leaf466]|uniref:glycosyltransferase n=1 Tax=Methylobacterium sp. Leaf466 TaxID=1736386 RepID=UPI0006F455BA|nr:glycosyltransferase [Methylobacterium sp. Leaf466]KQT84259.1 glycosyl transferase family 1 [Methylobacterium sp. Leaf466]
MRIAVLAHVRQPIAPPFRGGMEAHSWHLAEGLRARGHDVVLFASGDSDPRFTLDAVIPRHQEARFPGQEHTGDPALVAHLDAGYAAACDRIAAGGFDVVHNNSLSRLPLARERTRRVPTVTSLHVPPYDDLRWFVHDSVVPGHRLTVTSHGQLRAWFPDGAPPQASVLHNGIDPADWPYRDRGDGSAVWCGRITPYKGTHLAIQAARRAGIALTLFGSTEDGAYWESEVRPRLGGAIRYGGHLDGPSLAAEVGRASVFLFTPCWDEPFGLVAIEAMACGLPVASFDRGAAREVIGKAGAFASPDDEAALADAIGRAFAIPRRTAHDRVRRHFTHDVWLDGCERLYAAAMQDGTPGAPQS